MRLAQDEKSRAIKLTVIIVAWNNEGEIGQALQSAISPETSNYEVIVVYNGSDDQTLDVIQSFANKHEPLFRVIKNEKNLGSGEARNQGIQAAKGEYIVFLDGDDWFLPDALQTLHGYLSEHEPPVLYYNFERVYPDGSVEPNDQGNLLQRGWRITARERASLLQNFGVSWNRAYRRDFILEHDLKFPNGFYQDLSWNMEVLCLAKCIYVVPDILVRYRQREKSVLSTFGAQHFDILKASQRPLEFLQYNQSLIRDFGILAYRKCRDDLIGTLKLRIPSAHQSDFLNETSRIFSDYRELIGREIKMPRGKRNSNGKLMFSIVVVTWNNGSDISKALQSCIFPGFSNYEVIVVYNKSDDDTLAQVQSICGENKRLFRVIENDSNVGLGEARNQGIRAARGEYIAFLDGDDWFLPDALGTMDAYVAANRPEVLYYNFARSYPDGGVHPNDKPELLAEGWRDTGESRASLLRNFGVAWNRAYQRDFLIKHDLAFPPGLYEDICWNTKVLALAERVFVIPDILIMYRQRDGSILGSVGKQHFDTLNANRRVVQFLRERPDMVADFGLATYRYTQKQLIGTFTMRIPRDLRPQYLNEMRSVILEYESLLGLRRRSVEGELISWPISAHLIVVALSIRRSLRWRIRKLRRMMFPFKPTQSSPAVN